MRTIKNKSKQVYKEYFAQKHEANAPSGLSKLVWFMRISLFAFGILELIKLQFALGALILISVLFIVTPSFFTKDKVSDIPLEIEFFLFLMILVQFVIGEAGGFYRKISYYDKIVHFTLPFLISVIGFTIAYSLYSAKKLKLSVKTMMLFVILITVGIGALWEIIEFSSDQFLLPHFHWLHRFQGQDPKSAFYDTMFDLIADLFGGVVGAIVSSRYILEKKYNKRMNLILKETARDFFAKRRKKS